MRKLFYDDNCGVLRRFVRDGTFDLETCFRPTICIMISYQI